MFKYYTYDPIILCNCFSRIYFDTRYNKKLDCDIFSPFQDCFVCGLFSFLTIVQFLRVQQPLYLLTFSNLFKKEVMDWLSCFSEFFVLSYIFYSALWFAFFCCLVIPLRPLSEFPLYSSLLLVMVPNPIVLLCSFTELQLSSLLWRCTSSLYAIFKIFTERKALMFGFLLEAY